MWNGGFWCFRTKGIILVLLLCAENRGIAMSWFVRWSGTAPSKKDYRIVI